MKRKLFTMLCMLLLTATFAMAQKPAADKIVGNYKTVRNGVNSKIKIYKLSDGNYRAQVTWVDNLKKPDGSTLLDEKNKDKSKRNVPANQIVLVEKMSYVDGAWKNGKIYDPTTGMSFNVKMTFKDDKTLKVRGYLGIEMAGETMYWTKID